MSDQYKNYQKTIDSVVEKAAPITPHATNALPNATRSIYVGTGGDIELQLVGDSAPVTFKNVPDGSLLPLRVSHVLESNTTADDLVALL